MWITIRNIADIPSHIPLYPPGNGDPSALPINCRIEKFLGKGQKAALRTIQVYGLAPAVGPCLINLKQGALIHDMRLDNYPTKHNDSPFMGMRIVAEFGKRQRLISLSHELGRNDRRTPGKPTNNKDDKQQQYRDPSFGSRPLNRPHLPFPFFPCITNLLGHKSKLWPSQVAIMS